MAGQQDGAYAVTTYLALFCVVLSSVSAMTTLRLSEGSADDETQVTMALTIEDDNGLASRFAEFGDDLSVISDLRSTMGTEQSIAYIVQIKDPNDHVIFLSITFSAMGGNSTEIFRTTWLPEEDGEHVVQAFVWRDTEPPTILSYSMTKIEVYSAEDRECMGSASCSEGVVTKIVDGDTIDLDTTRIRLALVDTPEIGQAGHEEATMFTSEMCPVGSRVLVDEDDGQTSGSYGRQISKVFCGSKVINEELLKSGHAVILVEYCGESEFSAEQWAKSFGC